jgi:hypothetical protein
LAECPLYVSLDKDVMTAAEAPANWDSGYLTLTEVRMVLAAFRERAEELGGMDILGDWSPVCVRGWLRHLLHWTEHPSLHVVPEHASRRNAITNRALLDALAVPASPSVGS